MSPRKLVAALVVPLLLTAALDAAVFSGRVVKVKDESVELKVGSETIVFKVTEETMITLNGQEASLEKILPGQTAKINARKQDDAWIAKSLDAQLAPLTTPKLPIIGGYGHDWHASRQRAKIEVLRP